jgi:hypothetical protein
MVVLAALLAILLSTGCTTGRVVVEGEPGTVILEPPQGGGYYSTNYPEIPPGHMPPPGQCRIWVPGVPPGQQSPPGDCHQLKHQVPPGAWLIRGS